MQESFIMSLLYAADGWKGWRIGCRKKGLDTLICVGNISNQILMLCSGTGSFNTHSLRIEILPVGGNMVKLNKRTRKTVHFISE